MEIRFCETCGNSVSDRDIAQGEGFAKGDLIYCRTCYYDLSAASSEPDELFEKDSDLVKTVEDVGLLAEPAPGARPNDLLETHEPKVAFEDFEESASPPPKQKLPKPSVRPSRRAKKTAKKTDSSRAGRGRPGARTSARTSARSAKVANRRESVDQSGRKTAKARADRKSKSRLERKSKNGNGRAKETSIPERPRERPKESRSARQQKVSGRLDRAKGGPAGSFKSERRSARLKKMENGDVSADPQEFTNDGARNKFFAKENTLKLIFLVGTPILFIFSGTLLYLASNRKPIVEEVHIDETKDLAKADALYYAAVNAFHAAQKVSNPDKQREAFNIAKEKLFNAADVYEKKRKQYPGAGYAYLDKRAQEIRQKINAINRSTSYNF